MATRPLALIALALISATGGRAEPDTPPDVPAAPILRIESGGHSAPVIAMAADSMCRYVATASLDKTVRVWDAASGKPLVVLRPPIADGDAGELLAVAVSPDGTTVACGGETGYGGDGATVFLFDRLTAKVVRTVSSPEGVVHSLAFSRDGRYLAVGTDDDGGLSVYRTSDGRKVGQDETPHGSINSLQFAAPDAPSAPVRLVAASTDGVYLYKFLATAAMPLRSVAERDRPYGSTPGRLAFSPDCSKIVVGFSDSGAVEVLTGDDLTEKEAYRAPAADTEGGRENCVEACWSADGRQVFGAGTAGDRTDESTIYRWAVGGTDSPVRMPAGAYQVAGLMCPPQGGLLFCATSLPLGVFDAVGHRSLFHAFPPTRNDLPGDLSVSSDGREVAFPSKSAGKSARFSLRDLSLRTGTPSVDLQGPVTSRPGVAIRDGDDHDPPTLNGQELALDPAGATHCKAIAPDEQSFVVGTDLSLQCFNQDLVQVWSRTVPAAAWKVNVDGEGRVVVAALNDGTVRWYRMTDGAELCALYVDTDLTRWVAWTPAGDYAASPGGEDLFGWHVNHGLGRAAEFLPGVRLHDTKFHPALIEGSLDGPPIAATPDGTPAGTSRPPLPSVAAAKRPLTVGDEAHILGRVDRQMGLIRAVTAGDRGAVRASLASGADPNDTVRTGASLLSVAAAHGNTAVVDLLLAAGAKADARETNPVVHRSGMTTLMIVAVTGDVAVAKLLLKAGASVNARDSSGRTPLTYAEESGAGPDIVSLLKKSGGRR